MYNKLKVNLARNSLRFIIRNYEIKEIYIPYYLCDVIRHSIRKENCKAIFYHINDNFMPECEFDKDSYILYPNYFGICDKNVDTLCKKYPKIIIDNAHSFYSSPNGLACFNSERKFHDVFWGSDLWLKDVNISLEFEANEPQKVNPESYFGTCEPKFIKNNPDYNFISERKNAFLNLHKKYSETNLLIIDTNCVSPFCYPYLAKNETEANKLAKYYNKQGKCIYRYWNNLPKSYNEYKFFSRLVPLPL